MINKLEQKFNAKVLCIFMGGSKAYCLQGKSSDTDVMVILDDDKPLRHLVIYKNEAKIECFIVGKSYYRKVISIDEEVNDFIVVFADNILGVSLPGNLIYLDETYKGEFNAILKEDWLPKLSKFLHRFVSFYKLTINLDAPNYKKHYHVYRIRAMLDNLDLTGSFNLNYAEPYKTIMLVFKEHYSYIPSKQKEISNILDYIEDYAIRLETMK
ncbi:MAG: hypothetical protein PHX62_00785 [Bacilli bacterium]|nr:hypothetical protein [Bacilli bacterium]